MTKKNIFILIGFIIIILAGIMVVNIFILQKTNNEDIVNDIDDVELNPEIKPYILGKAYNLTDKNILVAEGYDGDFDWDLEKFIGNAGNFSINENTEIFEKNGNKLMFEDLNIGDTVSIWTDFVLESYPVQGLAKKIILEEKNTNNLKNTENKEKQCIISGCSGQICSEEEVITTCEFLPEYVCYKLTVCEVQPNGSCGWTETEEFLNCLKENK